MALIGNYSVLLKHPGRDVGGGSIGLGMHPVGTLKPTLMRGRFTHVNWDDMSGTPDGYRPPYSWVLPAEAGGLRSYGSTSGSASLAANLAGGVNVQAGLSGTGTVSDAQATLLGNIVAALVGSGTLSGNITGSLGAFATLAGSGSLSAFATALADLESDMAGDSTVSAELASGFSLVAALVGSGALTGNLAGSINAVASLTSLGSLVGDITGIREASAGLTGSGGLTTADLRAIAHLVSGLAGSGTLTTSLGAIPADISADISIGASDPLSPENLAAAVWNALAALYNDPGTMGEKLNSAGGAADPWDDPRALTLARFLGLK